MKLHLASFLQKENFGPGKIISICEGSKPKDIEVKQQFKHFIPSQDLVNKYYEMREKDSKEASRLFVEGYKRQLEGLVELIFAEAADLGVSVKNVLPFQDGDTLCSWEREQHTNYRKILAPYLEKLGYEVVLH